MLIPKPKTYACRCRKCDHRKRLNHHPDSAVVRSRGLDGKPIYVQRKCSQCRKGTYRIDKYRDDGREARRNKTCKPDRTGCQGYSFPHRKGSKWCDGNPNLTMDMRQERYESGHWH